MSAPVDPNAHPETGPLLAPPPSAPAPYAAAPPSPRRPRLPPPPPPVAVALDPRLIRLEILAVLLIFPMPAVVDAVAGLVEGLLGRSASHLDIPLPGQPQLSLLLLIPTVLSQLGVVALVLYLLMRSGEPPAAIGYDGRRPMFDAGLGVGLCVSLFVTVFVLGAVIDAITGGAGSPSVSDPTHLPGTYGVLAVVLGLTAGLVEETVVAGYLLHRLQQLGWRPLPAVALSTAVRTAYHVYYGVGVIALIPMGLIFAAAWWRWRRLWPLVGAHAVYDAVLFSVSLL